jgi:hypothetical protein
MEWRSRILMERPLPLPELCRGGGKRKRKFGRTQPGQALRRTQRPSRSSARRARHARRKEAAARGSARLRASLDGRCVRRSVRLQAGTEERRSNRTEKHHGRGRQVGTWRNHGGRTRLAAGSLRLVSRDASRVQWIGLAKREAIKELREGHFGET